MVTLVKKPIDNSVTRPVVPLNGHHMANNIDKNFIKNHFKLAYVPRAVFIVILFTILAQVKSMPFKIVLGMAITACIIDLIRSLPLFGINQRVNFILNTPLPSQLWQNASLKSLHLSLVERRTVEAGLKDFFVLHAMYPNKPLAMPSTLVDKLWHAFILDTKNYQAYCKKAFGKMFHHIPDYQFKDKNQNIQMFTWQSACRLQGLTPNTTNQTPRLFAIDPLLVTGLAVGGAMWLQHHGMLQQQYQQWQNQAQGSGCSNSGDDVNISDSGDCSCGGDGGGCGGGCGGGD